MTIADERYTIDIIIEARDRVAGAVAGAVSGLKDLDEQSEKSRNRLRELSGETARVSENINNRLRTEINKLNQEMRGSAGQVDHLAERMHHLDSRTKEVSDDMRRSQEQVDKWSENLRRADSRVQTLNADLSELEKRQAKVQEGGRAWNRYAEEIEKTERALKSTLATQGRWQDKLESEVQVLRQHREAVSDLNRVQEEREKLLKREEAQLAKTAQAYKRSIDEQIKARERLQKAEAAGAGAEGLAVLRRELADRERELERHRKNAERILGRTVTLKVGVDASEAMRDLTEIETMKEVVGTDIELNVDVDSANAMAKLAALETAKAAVDQDIDIDVDVDASRAIASLAALHRLAEENRHSIAQFDNQIRGLLAFMAVGLAQPLITALAGLAGQLVAVASSAVMAGTAIGVGLTSGMAQAIPMAGILTAALFRVAAVMEAVNQHTLMQKQQFGEAAKGGADLSAAADQVAAAEERLRQAQENLTRARFEARRELQDLIAAEREAQLAARASVLAQEESRAALRTAIREGEVFGTAEAQLRVDETRQARQQAAVDRRRAGQDVRAQRAGAVTAPDQSVAAAQQAVEDAQRGLEQARRSAKEAGDTMTEAGASLQFFLSRLSEAERELYQAILRIKRTWTQNIGPITDNLVESFTFAIDRVNRVLQNPRFLGAANALAEEMGQQMNRITRQFTSPRFIEFFNTMTREAKRNLGPITDAFLTLSDTFRRIADAGRPVFRLMVRLIGEAVDDFDKFVGRGKDLNDFFRESMKHLEAWWDLGRAVLRLFVAIIDSSAKHGLRTVRDFTDAINEATEWIGSHSKEMNKFWRDTRDILDEIASMFVALGKELVKSFKPEAVEALGTVVKQILIPGLGAAIRLMGEFFIILAEVAENDVAASIAKAAIAGAIAIKVFRTFFGLFISVAAGIGKFVKAIASVAEWIAKTGRGTGFLAGAMRGLSRVFAVLLGPIGAAIAAFILLADEFGVLDDIWRAMQDAAGSVVKEVKPALDELIEAFEDVIDMFTGGGGLMDVFRFFFVNIVLRVVIPIIKEFGEFIGKYLGGAIKIFAGVIKTVVGIITLDGDKIKEGIGNIVDGVKSMLEGVVRIITLPFRTAFGILRDIVGAIADWASGAFDTVIDAFGSVGDAIVDAFNAVKGPLIDVINFIIGEVINRIPGVEIGLIETGVSEETSRRQSRVNRRQQRQYSEHRQAFRASGGRVGMQTGGSPVQLMPQRTTTAGAVVDKIGDLFAMFGQIDFGFLPDWMAGLGTFIIEQGKEAVKSLWQGAGGIVDDVTGFLDPLGGGGPNLGDLFSIGGHVVGSGGIDTIPAMLTRDEFVVTPHGESLLERITGIPGILNWLAGRQRRATGFQEGGRADGGGGGAKGRPRKRAQTGDVGDAIGVVMEALETFASEGVEIWEGAWNQITKITQEGAQTIGNILNRLVKRATKEFDDMRDKGAKSSRSLLNTFRENFGELQKVVYEGLSYIGNQTSKALKAFDAKEVNLNLQKPDSEGKARGGFIGSPGERGGDMIPAWLGRGEAVLNWAHQRVVDPALRSMYGFGLNEMFGKVSGSHAQGRSGGFAAGGMVRIPGDPNLTGGRDTVAPSVVDLASWLVRTFNLEVGYAYDPGGGHVSPGHNVTGMALDVVPGPGSDGWSGVNQAVAWAVKHGLTVYYDGQFGSTPLENHGEGNHAHFELKPGVEGFGGIATEIKKLVIEGTAGAFKEGAQNIVDMVRDAANEYIKKKTAFDEGAEVDVGKGSIANAIAEIGRGLNAPREAILAAYMAAIVESGDPTLSTNPDYGDSSSRGIFQLLSSTAAGMGIDPMNISDVIHAFYQRGFWGRGGAIELAKEGFPASDIAQMVEGSAFPERYGEVANTARAFMKAEGFSKGGYPGGTPNDLDVGEEFASGGQVGKRSPKGAAVPIVAHAGEWVVNESQQMKLAGSLGTSIGRLRDMLGFTGGPFSFQGGGAPRGGGSDGKGMFARAWEDLEEIREDYNEDARKFRRAKGKLEDNIRKFFSKLTGEGGVLDQLAAEFEEMAARMETRLTRAVIDLNRRGRVIGRDMGDLGFLDRELKSLRQQLRFLLGEDGVLDKAMKEAQRALRRAKRDGDRDAIQAARAAVNNIRARQRELDSQIAAQQLAVLDKMEERMALRAERVDRRAELALSGFGGVDIRRRVAEVMGNLGILPGLNQAEAGIIEQQIGGLQEVLRQARRRGNKELARELELQIADLNASLAEMTAQMLQDAVDEIERQAGRRETAIDIQNRMADIRGAFGQNELAEQMRGAALGAQRASLQTQLAGMQAILAQAIIDGFGEGVTGPLQDQIDDLIAQLAENEQAQYENTIAIRQATIDSIAGRQEFFGGIPEALIGLLEGIGAVTGTPNTAAMIALMQRAIVQLTETGTALREQMARLVSETGLFPPEVAAILQALQGLHGQEFVDAVQGLDLEAIIASLGPDSPLAEQFQALLDAIIENEAALWSNTEELQNLQQQTQMQQFTSTAWQWFRRAIFTGMGGLLPQYGEGTPFGEAVPGMQEGGGPTMEGLHYLHAGEWVLPRRMAGMARMLMQAGSMAGSLSTGGIPEADLALQFATGRAATIHDRMSGIGGRGGAANEYRKLRDALLKNQQHNEFHVHGREARDDRHLAETIAFRTKIPVT